MRPTAASLGGVRPLIFLESPLAATNDDAGLFLGQAELFRTVLMRAA
jgi:hypothetical protein